MKEHMKKPEIIHLRLGGKHSAGLIDLVRTSIETERSPTEVRVYHHATVDTDIAIHIRSSEKSACTSDLGIRLTDALREHGMVEHTVWIEEKNRDRNQWQADTEEEHDHA